MLDPHSKVTVNGLLFNDSEANPGFHLTDLQGIGTGPAVFTSDQNVQADGTWSTLAFEGGIAMGGSGYVEFDNPVQVDQALQKLKLAISVREFPLTMHWPSGDRTRILHRDGELLVTRPLPTKLEYSWTAVGDDPNWYAGGPDGSGGVQIYTTRLPRTSGGFTFPFSFPFAFTGSSSSGDIEISTVLGGRWLWRIDGPVTNPRVIVLQDGVAYVVRWNLTLATGEFLIIDPQAETSLLQGTASRPPVVRQWTTPQPGNQTVSFRADSVPPDTPGEIVVTTYTNRAVNPFATDLTGWSVTSRITTVTESEVEGIKGAFVVFETNRLTDPSAELGDGWVSASPSTLPVTFDTNFKRSGSVAVRQDVVSGSNLLSLTRVGGYATISIQNSITYAYGAWIYSEFDGALARMTITPFVDDIAQTTVNGGWITLPANTWTWVSMTWTAPSSGVVKAQPNAIVTSSTGSPPAGTSTWIDDATFVTTSTATGNPAVWTSAAEVMSVTAGETIPISLYARRATEGAVQVQCEWRDAVGGVTYSATDWRQLPANTLSKIETNLVVPSTAVTARIVASAWGATLPSGRDLFIGGLLAGVDGSPTGQPFDGDSPAEAIGTTTITYDWDGTPYLSSSTATQTYQYPPTPPPTMLTITLYPAV